MTQEIMKKLFSIFAVLMFVGSVGATGLGNYPENFLVDGRFNGKIVVGEDARASDSIGALFLADSLRANRVEIFEPSGDSVSEDITLGETITSKLSQELTDNDVEGLLDTEINFQNSDYDVSEVIILGQSGNDLTVHTSLTGSDDDYESNIVMELDRDAIKYFYRFDQSIDITDATALRPLEIDVLGKTIQIIDVDSNSKFTAFVGEEYFLGVNDEILVEGKTVKLVNVGAGGNIVIEVDGKVETITEDDTESVNGIEINNNEVFYTENTMERAATLIIGRDAVETYSDGDAFIGQDEDDPEWVWNIGNLQTEAASNPSSTSDGSGPFIGIENDFILNDDKDNPTEVGEEISLPFDYVKVRLDSLTVEDEDYKSYTFEYDDSADLSDALGDSFSDANAVSISVNEDDGLLLKSDSLSTPTITGDVKVKQIWLFGEDASNLDVLYEDEDDNKVKLAGKIDNDTVATFAQVNYGNTKSTDVVMKANFSPASSSLVITVSPNTSDVSNDDIVMTFGLSGNDVSGLGSSASQDEAGELTWNSNTIGTKDEDLRTKYGIVIRDPGDNGNSDEVVLEVPDDEVKVNVVVFGKGGTVRSVVKDAFIPEIVLDSEVSDENMVLIGGPAVNSKVAELLGVQYPSYGTSDSFNVESGQALIKFVEQDGKQYLIIAGFSARDTRDAADLMSNFNENSALFEGQTEKVINLIRA